MPKLDAIVLDMDGLMVDTESLSQQAWQVVLRDFNCRLNGDIYNLIIGRRSDESAQILQKALNLPISAADLLSSKTEIFNRMITAGVSVMSGLVELLAEIMKRSLPWAVATSSPRHYAKEILSQIGYLGKCHAIATGDEVTKSKPEPDIYLLVAQRLSVLPQQCLVLEDSVPGCQAAVAAGMVTIAVPTAQTKNDDFSFVHHVFDSLYAVVDNLDRLIDSETRPAVFIEKGSA